MKELLYEDRPRYGLLLKIVVWGILAVMLVMAITMFDSSREEAFVSIGTAVFILLIFWAVMPRKYCIYEDKIKIVMGTPFSLSIRFDTIKYAGEPRGKLTVGINFVTSFRNTVEIVRKRGMNVNISPGDREAFLENLNNALYNWRGEQSQT
jgi:hypothetical protein